jgi:hypothetical protein
MFHRFVLFFIYLQFSRSTRQPHPSALSMFLPAVHIHTVLVLCILLAAILNQKYLNLAVKNTPAASYPFTFCFYTIQTSVSIRSFRFFRLMVFAFPICDHKKNSLPTIITASPSHYPSSDHSSSSATAAKVGRKLSVSFHPHALIYDHIHVHDLSDNEKNRTWYSRRDLHRIKRETEDTVQRMMMGSSSNGVGFCSRGLEYRTPIGVKLHQKHRWDALTAVLEYQYKHWRSGVKPESLARVYSDYTKHSSRVSRLMATIDEQSIEPKEPTSTAMITKKTNGCFASGKTGSLAVTAC